MELFIEITLLVLLSFGSATLMRFLKQPLLVGYILAGIVAGPYVFNILHARSEIELLSKIGITILLFIVGLNLSPTVIKEVGKVSLITGIGQVIITTSIGFIIALILGINEVAALYIAIALTFSSTIVILKLLSDKGDTNKLYGKIAIGFLIIQDIVATVILLFVSSFTAYANQSFLVVFGSTIVKGTVIALVLYVFSGLIIPRLSKFFANSQELLSMFALAWGFGVAALFYSLGFSVEIGALVAGVVLSMTPYALEIGSRLKPMRDFFIVLFFVLLGSQMVIDALPLILFKAIILSLFVLIGNPVIVIIIMNLLGYKRKISFQSGLTVAQISEFSLILAILGFNLGHLDRTMLSLVTLVGLITIAGSTYFILYSDAIFPKVERLLSLLEFRKQQQKGSLRDTVFDLLLFGYDRVGKDFVDVFKNLHKPFAVIDFNPATIEKLNSDGTPAYYGDAEDPEFLKEVGIDRAKLVISTMPDFKTNTLLVERIRAANKAAIIIVISHDVKQAKTLYEKGASYVIMPHYLGARYAVNMINRLKLESKDFKEEREKHLTHLESRLANAL